MKKLLLILLIFSESTYAMEKAYAYILKVFKKEQARTVATPIQVNLEIDLDRKLLNALRKLSGKANNTSEQEIREITDLIEQGANVNFCLGYGHHVNVLMDAAFTGNAQIIQLLLDRGAIINREFLADYIMFNNQQPETAVIKLLIERGAHINAKKRMSGETALTMAAKFGYSKTVQTLLEGDGPAFAEQLRQLRHTQPQSYLSLLPLELMTPVSQYVRTNRADPNITDYCEKKALIYAIERQVNLFHHPENRVNLDQQIKAYQEIINLLEPVTTKKDENKKF